MVGEVKNTTRINRVVVWLLGQDNFHVDRTEKVLAEFRTENMRKDWDVVSFKWNRDEINLSRRIDDNPEAFERKELRKLPCLLPNNLQKCQQV